jgi:serine/threonine protein kinase
MMNFCRAAAATEAMSTRKAMEIGRLQPGVVFAGKYEVLAYLGSGPEGALYTVRDAALNQLLALRLSTLHLTRGPRFVQDLRRELLLDRRTAHENVERVYAVGEHDGLLFVVAEHVPGPSLAESLSTRGPLPLPECLSLFKQVCAGLAVLHDAGAVHGALNARTVMVARGGTVKLTGAGLGAGEISQAEDLRAAGALFVEMLAGRPPSVLPDEVAGALRRCLENDPARRFRNGRELIDAVAPRPPATLAELAGEDPAAVERVAPLFVRVVDRVIAIHAGGQVARALTPGGIRLRPNGEIDIDALPAGSLQNTVAAEPKYCPPEMFQEGHVEPGDRQGVADVYVLGFAFYEILLGRRLFREQFRELGPEPEAFQWLRWQADPQKGLQPLHELMPGFPAPLSELVSRMTEKDPVRRVAGLGEVRQALERFGNRSVETQQFRTGAQDEPPAAKRGRRVARVLLAMAMIAGFGAGAWLAVPHVRARLGLDSAAVQPDRPPDYLDTPTGRMVLFPTAPGFYLDEFEITNWLYKKFCDETGRPYSTGPGWDEAYFANPEYPVRHISEEDFRAFAHWAGKRLPTRAELARAAPRFHRQRHPWQLESPGPPGPPPPPDVSAEERAFYAAVGFRCAADPPGPRP